MTHPLLVTVLALWIVLSGTAVRAQERVPVRVEAFGGYAIFGDSGSGDHGIFGAKARWLAASRIGVGPEFAYMIGPGRDRDLFLMGGLTVDLLRERRVTPYVSAAAGLMGHSDEGASWSELALVVGLGARIKVRERLFVGFECREGKPLHVRLEAGVGYRF